MALAGTLSRPSSAQGGYTLTQLNSGYYRQQSPAIPPVHAKPGSTSSNLASDPIYTGYRKSIQANSSTPRQISSHYVAHGAPNSPTRIYGTQVGSRSADDLELHSSKHKAQTRGPTRSQTTPDMRPLVNAYDAVVPSVREPAPTKSPIIEKPTTPTRLESINQRFDVTQKSSPVAIKPFEQRHQTTQSRSSMARKENFGIEPAPETNRGQYVVSPALAPLAHATEDTLETATEFITSLEAGIAHHHNSTSPTAGATAMNETYTRHTSPQFSAIHEQRSASLRTAPSANGEGAFKDPPRSNTPVPANYTSEEKSTSLKSRLRRALSFSSSSNLSQMADAQAYSSAGQARRMDKAIYNNGNQSTDNISVASTASTASILLRKMGHGLSKKTKRSFHGIFSGARLSKSADRPGTPAGFDLITPSTNYASAEFDRPASQIAEYGHSRAKDSISSIQTMPQAPARTLQTQVVADNVDGHGSVGFPQLSPTAANDRSRRASMHLERPLPIDAPSPVVQTPNSRFAVHNRSDSKIAQTPLLTACVQPFTGKGILKKSSEVVSVSPQTNEHAFDFDFGDDPLLNLRTPIRRKISYIDTEASYETPASTPRIGATILKFSPRITIHDTYTHFEYDRRGEIATCNKLTPLLAQRIKEELNAYKMDEMDVAEGSKAYTHFFT